MKVHNELLNKQYYFNLKNPRLAEILRSCVANEYGNYFSNLNMLQNDKFKVNYIKAIEELCKSHEHEVKCKLMALHLIMNSIDQDKNTNLVDVRMKESLNAIYSNEEINRFCKSEGLRQFFADNLNDIDK